MFDSTVCLFVSLFAFHSACESFNGKTGFCFSKVKTLDPVRRAVYMARMKELEVEIPISLQCFLLGARLKAMVQEKKVATAAAICDIICPWGEDESPFNPVEPRLQDVNHENDTDLANMYCKLVVEELCIDLIGKGTKSKGLILEIATLLQNIVSLQPQRNKAKMTPIALATIDSITEILQVIQVSH